ncbi:MAG: hypothetical protein JXR96_05235 [Deltaproteobacteria bacterium]|nr:hypothetical protein [Deltaproteobacteria bacterium]
MQLALRNPKETGGDGEHPRATLESLLTGERAKPLKPVRVPTMGFYGIRDAP